MCGRNHRRQSQQSPDNPDPASPSSPPPPSPPPAPETDIFDDIWNSITDRASLFTRSLVGLPMLYRHTSSTDPSQSLSSLPTDDTLTVFAEPGILSPKIITFHLDRDVAGTMYPFRLVSRPVTVFDVFSEAIRVPEHKFGSGMMFLFGSPLENARWLITPGIKFTGNSMFRPWNDRDEWIRRSADEMMEEAFDRSTRGLTDQQLMDNIRDFIRRDKESLSGFKTVFEEEFQKGFAGIRNEETSRYTETRTSTNVTINPDGSSRKETITTEKLADGSSKETRIVETTASRENGGRPIKQERTVKTTPPTKRITSIDDTSEYGDRFVEKEKENGGLLSDYLGDIHERLQRMEKQQDEKKTKETNGKGNGDNTNNWTWWFWSRK